MKRELFLTILLGIILFTVPITSMQMRLMGMQMYSPPMREYSAGWEVVSGIYGIKLTQADLPSDVKGKLWKSGDKFTEGTAGLGVWAGVDVDGQPYALCPDITIQVDQAPIHVDKGGDKTPDDRPIETITKRIGDRYYVYDLHLFQLGIDVHTVADVDGPYWAWGQSYWYHEIGSRFGEKLKDSDLPGLPWEGSIYVRFSIKPWIYHYELINETITVDGETYYLLYDENEPVIAAVMLVEVFEIDTYTYTDVEQLIEKGYKFKADYGIESYPSEKSDLNMYLPKDLSSYSGSENPAQLSPSEVKRLKTDIVFEIPLKMLVGAYVATNWYGAYKEIIPVDPGIHITVHVEVLTVHNFVLETSPTAEEVQTQQEIVNYTQAPQPFWAQIGNYFRENPSRLWVFGFGLLVFGALLITFFIPVPTKVRGILVALLIMTIGVAMFVI